MFGTVSQHVNPVPVASVVAPRVADSSLPLFSADDIISTYSIEEGVEDGILVDLRAQASDVTNQHYGTDARRRPVVCTIGVWDLIERAVNNPRWMNDLNGVVHDIMWMSRGAVAAIVRGGESRALPFIVYITGTGRVRKHTLMVHVVMHETSIGSVPGAATFHLPTED
jgi:hypothetical protein